MDDPLEREADRVANTVVGEGRSAPISFGASRLQRKCASCDDEDTLQRKGRDGSATAAPDHVARRIDARRGGGRGLDAGARSFFEPRFGHDFGRVRVHTDGEAAALTDAVRAEAFTVGSDVYFARGRFDAASVPGRRLLAHELTHVVQQARGGSGLARTLRRQTRVTISHSGTCAGDPSLIAAAIPLARNMVWTARDWMNSYNPREQARVDSLLSTIFGSSSESTRTAVADIIGSMIGLVEGARSGQVHFECEGAGSTECGNFAAFVRVGEGSRVHLCPAFFGDTLEQRRWTLIHEFAHLAGAVGRAPEEYFLTDLTTGAMPCSGSVGTMRRIFPGQDPRQTTPALSNADHYARFIWCLTRRPGTPIVPPAP